MSSFYLGFWLANLLIPGDPDRLSVTTPTGTWEFEKHYNFASAKIVITNGEQCAVTYSVEHTGTYTGSHAAAQDAALDELIPLCLGASYLTGLSVTPHSALPHSEVSFLQFGDHFPRARAMGTGFPMPATDVDFAHYLGSFVASYNTSGATEKIRLIAHHFLDALAFWSLEDLVLSTTTILEIIAATSETLSNTHLNFNQGITWATSRFGIASLPPDFRRMRNDLVHEGTLSGTNFPGKNASDCGRATAEALDWIDAYVFAAMGMGASPQARFAVENFQSANSFSL